MHPLIRSLTTITSLVLLAGCSTFNRPNASNTSRAQFLDEVWVAPELKGKLPSDLFFRSDHGGTPKGAGLVGLPRPEDTGAA